MVLLVPLEAYQFGNGNTQYLCYLLKLRECWVATYQLRHGRLRNAHPLRHCLQSETMGFDGFLQINFFHFFGIVVCKGTKEISEYCKE